MRARRPGARGLSRANLEVMNVVWQEGEVSVAQVWAKLRAARPVARNTVQTLMKRLEEKGWLRHRTVGRTFLYSATVARAQTLRHMVRSLLHSAFAGSTEGLVAALLEGRRIGAPEAERIRRMIEEAKEGKS